MIFYFVYSDDGRGLPNKLTLDVSKYLLFKLSRKGASMMLPYALFRPKIFAMHLLEKPKSRPLCDLHQIMKQLFDSWRLFC